MPQPFLNVGIAAALTTAAVTGVLITLTSGFKMSVSGPDGTTVVYNHDVLVRRTPDNHPDYADPEFCPTTWRKPAVTGAGSPAAVSAFL